MSDIPSSPIAASESKSTFMAGIGLVTGQAEGERMYKLMKEDAVDAYRRVVQVKSDSSYDASIAEGSRPRYGYTEIPKEIIQEAISTIYANASTETRPYYDLGRSDTGGETNWVIRWMLWHTFRYRDSRNKRGQLNTSAEKPQWQEEPLSPLIGRAPSIPDEVGLTSQFSPVNTSSLQEQTPSKDLLARGSGIGRSLPYDPVRG